MFRNIWEHKTASICRHWAQNKSIKQNKTKNAMCKCLWGYGAVYKTLFLTKNEKLWKCFSCSFTRNLRPEFQHFEKKCNFSGYLFWCKNVLATYHVQSYCNMIQRFCHFHGSIWKIIVFTTSLPVHEAFKNAFHFCTIILTERQRDFTLHYTYNFYFKVF